ncbi:response regulator [Desulfovibrio inopinatus]|uniref:response regulator n=1 Tax=Desulfovibrio inopinatus TaxID=102109 RepID=UPI000417CD4E|nr:response regulator [Desulfovibrio inopinatus]
MKSHTIKSSFEPTKNPCSILIVEDEAANRLAMSLFLERFGHTVTKVQNGIEAVNTALSEKFDIILMDIQLPGLDGVEATRRIRTEFAERELTAPIIIALTAHAMAGDREKLLSSGMDDYISKPLDLFDLIAIIDRHCARLID